MNRVVSILIPTYNRKTFLVHAIKSALQQTHTNIEILVLDDASSDGTPEAISAIVKDDRRLQYIRHENNKGIAANWKHGMSIARGDFFCILHDDDTFAPDFVATLLKPLIADPSLILSFCDHWVVAADGRRLDVDTEAASRYFHRDQLTNGVLASFFESALVDFAVPVGATLFRRSVVTPEMIDTAAAGAIDCWLFYQCVRTGMGAYYLPDRLMNYRMHCGGMSRNMPVYMLSGHIHRLEIARCDEALKPHWNILRNQLYRSYADLGITLLKAGETKAARDHLLKSAWHCFSIRTYVALLASALGPAGSFWITLPERIRRAFRHIQRTAS